MAFDVRYASHPNDARHYDTATLRRHFLIDQLFSGDNVELTYSHTDRIVVGGAMPVSEALSLPSGKELGANSFFERREAGIINIGDPGIITIDGERFELGRLDGLYVGMGVTEVNFESVSKGAPAKFYINSAPAHRTYPVVKIGLAQAKTIRLGDTKTNNKRTIYQYVHPEICESCQLLLGLTRLETGSCWNTMPCHTHERRMEVYFYFDVDPNETIVHLMGEPTETRHIMVANEQAVISPSWSIHSGVGTGAYTFIWGMCGENQTFDDMDHIRPVDLR